MTDPTTHVTVGLAAGTTITVDRLRATAGRRQGIVLDADGVLRVGDVEAPRLVLWSDTSPEHVDVFAEHAGRLRIWHVWADGDLVQAWEAAAVLSVDDSGDDLHLRAVDGHGGPEPDLEVRIGFDRAWTQPTS